nr:RNA-directed DNA polymerase, eukaryota, reverse transcriptase zinc-binding domain protein [Tanacetum cinerariifolium]
MGNGTTYVNAVKSPIQQGSSDSEIPALVLDDDYVISKDLSNCLLGRVKEFASLANIKMTLNNEGFMNIKISYMGEMWVMLKFGDIKSMKLFKENDYLGGGWVPDFMEEADEEEHSDVDSKYGRFKVNERDIGDDSDVEGVLDTLFEEDESIKKQSDVYSTGKQDSLSEDLFDIYPLLKKKGTGVNNQEYEFSLRYPLVSHRRKVLSGYRRMLRKIEMVTVRVGMSDGKLAFIIPTCGGSGDKIKGAASKLGYLTFKTPFMYLGSIVGGSMSRIQAWTDVVDRVSSRLSKWKMNMLSIGGRLTLVKSVFKSMPIFHMSIFKAPLGVLRKLESIQSHLFNGFAPNCNNAS